MKERKQYKQMSQWRDWDLEYKCELYYLIDGI